jgi:crotonobetainyl-CoA:carnitine CoA-transferase CaiB-like acyl-CoA transferase
MNRRVHGHMGNRHPSLAPSGVFPCRGEEAWIAIAVGGDEEFEALAAAMARPELASDERYADVVSRRRNQDELERALSEWTRGFEPYELMRLLQAAGVRATVVTHQRDLLHDPHLEARGFWTTIEHPDAGTHRYPARIARFERVPIDNTEPAPTLGQHNREILVDLLGVSEREYEELLANGEIGVTYHENAT